MMSINPSKLEDDMVPVLKGQAMNESDVGGKWRFEVFYISTLLGLEKCPRNNLARSEIFV